MESFFDIAKAQLLSLRPSFLTKKPHFNFITVHYFYVFGLTILGSVLIYAPGKSQIRYIDALSFAAGASTQAGLNPVNVNALSTYQQVIIYIIAGIANPITINSFVVLLRLYWFEKRFQHIVQEARFRRGTISKSKMKAKDDLSRLERGVNGRNITIIHNGARSRLANDGTYLGPLAASTTDDGPARGGTGRVDTTGPAPRMHRRANSSAPDNNEMAGPKHTMSDPLERRQTEIKFAPTVKRSDGVEDETIKLPPRLTNEEHLAILQRQRNPSDEVLRIPGPRDVERGVLPSRVSRSETDGESAPGTSWSSKSTQPPSSRQSTKMQRSESPGGPSTSSGQSTPTTDAALNGAQESRPNSGVADDGAADGGQQVRQGITIQEPEKRMLPEDKLENIYAAAAVVSALTPHLPLPHHQNGKPNGLHSDDDDDNDNDEGGGRRLRQTFSAFSKRRQTLQKLKTAFTRDKDEAPAPYLSWEPTLGRNSAFLGLSAEQREELGGIEYRSLKTLAVVLLIYYWGFWLFSIVCLIPWITKSKTYGQVVDDANQTRVWWGFFTAQSAFMDLGFTLTSDSMNSFNTAVFPLLVMSFLIVIGNTGFPVMLRFVIWVTSLVTPRGSGLYEEFKFLLDHPRRCFTLLFPSGATWWLFWLLVALNGIDLLFFCVLDLGNGPVYALPAGIRVLDGLFQAFSTRTAGFSCVNLSSVHPAVQASYMIMMYISVFPIAISVRRTNVYEENSLGVYSHGDEDDTANGTDLEYVGAHLRRQLSFDLWFLSAGFFILTICEGGSLQAGDFSMFAVLFEVVSAYGTVGLSLGYSGGNESLSSQFSVLGKLVIIAMMIRGRHRGLPYGLDRAILLPSESLNAKEAAAEAAADHRNSAAMLPSVATRRSSMNSARPGLARTVSATTRDRRRSSRSVERNNILAQFLHPGPVATGGGLLVPPVIRRSHSQAVDDDDEPYTTGFEPSATMRSVRE